jgi:hypothetical protein
VLSDPKASHSSSAAEFASYSRSFSKSSQKAG